MLFQLPSFLIFLVVFASLLTLLPPPWRLPYVVGASLVFYGWWYPPYTLLLLALVAFSWLGVRWVIRSPDCLPLLIGVAVLPLLVFKYTDFVLVSTQRALGIDLPQLGWQLPLGISFVTFTVVSLLVDTARRRGQSAPGFWETAAYITFFPHLIAGPILRAAQTLPQLVGLRLDRANLWPNLVLFAFGIMKKVLIADPVGAYVDEVYGQVDQVGGLQAALAIIGFSVQIYCDFSAYSDMAIALAGMFGIRFPENFHSPYLAWSFSELWRRWHMTLTLWLRDYVFFPLHKHFKGRLGSLATLATMLVSGLWHGAAWTFVAWGGIHGLLLVMEHVSGFGRIAARQGKLGKLVCGVGVFSIWTMAAVLFRAQEWSVAITIWETALGIHGWGNWPSSGNLILGLVVLTLLVHAYDQVDRIRQLAGRLPIALCLPVVVMVILGCAMLAAGRPQNFYYFDF